jgi:REP element-mobilizing transposase RayT
MSRTKQNYSKEKYSHILIKGTMSHQLFKSDKDYDKFIKILSLKQSQFLFKLLAYSLFPDHVHIIIEESSKSTIASILHGVTTLYTRYYQNKYYISGPILAGGYHRDLISNHKDLLCRIRYIHQKPKLQKLSSGLHYKYSSYTSYCNPDKESFLHRSTVYRLFDAHDDTIASNLFKSIHHESDNHKIFDIDENIFEKVAIAKKILKEELSNYQLNYENIPKNLPFRENLILRIHNQAKLSHQEIADLLSISRHVVGRTIRFHRPT